MLVITPQERDALQMLADGTPTEAIARHLGVSVREADATVRALFATLGSTTRNEALAEAVRRGLVSPVTSGSPEPCVPTGRAASDSRV